MDMDISIQAILTQLSHQLQPYSETSALDAQVLLAHCLKKPRSWVLAHPEIHVNETQFKSIIQASDRLIQGEALPYVIGHWEFYGLDFHLSPATLIPRPETELLVEQAINWLRLHSARRKAVDVGTGSGCIGISLAKHIPDLHILLTDISSDALSVARINAERYALLDRIVFTQADLLTGIAGPFDLICANLPYIPTQTLPTLAVTDREPLLALDGGLRGVEVISRLLSQSKTQLAHAGLMLLEIDASQGMVVKNLADIYYPASKVKILKDLSRQDRCVEIELSTLIAHLCTRQDWQQAQFQGIFQDQSLLQNGFIHCAAPEQILEVANRFYQRIPDLVLLWIEPDRLTSTLHWEAVDDATFPHVYGPINLDAVTSVTDLKPEVDGEYHNIQLPD
jgi:release factor glutamine methyltransferase